MQRCLQAWMPLPRARLQAAATQEYHQCFRAIVKSSRLQQCQMSTISTNSRHDVNNDALDDDRSQAQTTADVYFDLISSAAAEGDDQTIKSTTVLPIDKPPSTSKSTERFTSTSRQPHVSRPLSRRSKLDQMWFKMYRTVTKKYEKEQGIHSGDAGTLKLHEYAEQWVNYFLDLDNQRGRWAQAAMWLMNNDIERVLGFLLESHRRVDVSAAWIGDIIRLLALYYADQEEYVARPFVTKLTEALELLIQRPRSDPLTFEHDQVRLLLPHLAHGEVQKIFEYINDGALKVNWPTYCHLCRHFAEQGDIEQAVDALISALPHYTGAQKQPIFDSLLYIIGRLVRRPDGYRQSIRLVENLKHFGVEMDTHIANNLLRNAQRKKQYQVAFDLYRLLFIEQREPDESTFAILLQILRADPESQTGLSLEYVIDEAFRTEVVYKSEVIANQVLHTFITHVLYDPETAWPQLCHLFSRLFAGNALEALDMPKSEITEEEVFSSKRQPATDRAVTTMIQAYLKIHNAGHLQQSDPVDVYKNYQSLVTKGVQPFLKMATTDHTSNIFLASFAKQRETLINATEVMKDMQTPLPQSMGVERAKPTVQSWNIFLMGFQRHDKPQLVEQILQYMRNEGMQPDQVTWNELVHGYAHDQELDDLVRTLEQAEEAGVEFDDYTEKALNRFRDQPKLHDALKERRMRRELDFSNELKSSIGERLQAVDTTQQDT